MERTSYDLMTDLTIQNLYCIKHPHKYIYIYMNELNGKQSFCEKKIQFIKKKKLIKDSKENTPTHYIKIRCSHGQFLIKKLSV